MALPVPESYPDGDGHSNGVLQKITTPNMPLSEADVSEIVIIQGVVDCLVDEGDGWLLVDYKTDRIAPGQLEEAAKRYRGQLNLYARAVESILGKKVKEKYIYLFQTGLAISL
jgi:ATP-dependent helicase/nuclease subunit A